MYAYIKRHFTAGQYHWTGVKYKTYVYTCIKGHFVAGQYHGTGVKVWPNAQRYKGEWRHGREHGRGLLSYPVSALSLSVCVCVCVCAYYIL